VVRRAKGSRNTASNAGRKKGSKRRSICTIRSRLSDNQFNSFAPVRAHQVLAVVLAGQRTIYVMEIALGGMHERRAIPSGLLSLVENLTGLWLFGAPCQKQASKQGQ
jgi:hypothetical protein